MLPSGLGMTNYHIGAPAADTTIATKPGDSAAPLIYASALLHPGSAAASLIIYDGPISSNKIIAMLVAAANGASAADVCEGYKIVVNSTTIHAALVGTGAQADIRYKNA